MSSENRALRVLVVDDDPDIQDIISLCIELNWPGSLIISSSDGQQGIDQFRKSGADLIVLDLGLPDIDGLTVCKTIRAESKVPIVMVTARGQESDVIKGLNAGGDDYIVKPFSRGEFIARLTSVLRRAGTLEHSATFSDGPLEIDFENRDVKVDGNPVRLSSVEFNILARLIESHGTVVTSRELLDLGWGAEYGDAISHLDLVVEGLERKLGLPGDGTGIVKSSGVGYRYVQMEPAS